MPIITLSLILLSILQLQYWGSSEPFLHEIQRKTFRFDRKRCFHCQAPALCIQIHTDCLCCRCRCCCCFHAKRCQEYRATDKLQPESFRKQSKLIIHNWRAFVSARVAECLCAVRACQCRFSPVFIANSPNSILPRYLGTNGDHISIRME